MNPVAALGYVNKALDLLARIVLKKDSRVLDPRQGAVIGGSTVLSTPPNTQSNLVQIPVEQTDSVSITPIFESRADNQSNPEVITVNIMPPNEAFAFLNPFDGNVLWDLKARIEWGTGGGQSTADVDIRNGTMVTVLGTYARVSAIFTGLTGAGALPSVTVNASASYGGRGASNAPPTWTGFIATTAANADSVSMFIPSMARDVTVYCLDSTTGMAAAVDIFILNGNRKLVEVTQLATTDNPAYRIPTGLVNRMSFHNHGANAASIIIVFGLGL